MVVVVIAILELLPLLQRRGHQQSRGPSSRLPAPAQSRGPAHRVLVLGYFRTFLGLQQEAQGEKDGQRGKRGNGSWSGVDTEGL